MDAESFVLIFVLVATFIPFVVMDLFRDPEETARRDSEIEKSEWRHH